MRKLINRKSVLCSAVTGIVLAALLIWKRSSFLALKEDAEISLILAIAAAVVAVLCQLFIPKRKTKRYIVYLLFAFLLAPLFVIAGVEFLNSNMLWEINYPVNALMNYLLCLMLEITFYALSGSVMISADLMTAVMTVFGIVNMYCKEYKGSPLLPWDITSIGTAANVAGSFKFEITPSVVFMICMSAASVSLVCHLRMPEKSRKIRMLIRILSIVAVADFAYFFWGTDIIAEEFGATPDFFNQSRGYENYGAWAEFMVNTRYLHLSKPDGYDPDQVTETAEAMISEDTPTILESALLRQGASAEEAEDASRSGSAENPNIIVIMNESFSDLSVIGDFETNTDYMPYINSLIGQENVIEGNSYVSTIGTGTSNTEFEFLTGNTMAFLPAGSNAYQLYVTDSQPGLTSTLKDQGYSADALHPYYSSSWNRVAVYNAMGFNSFLSIENLKDVVKVRRFASDAYDFSKVEELYENRDPDQPFYLFNVTMQNHSSYETEYSNFEQEVWLTSTENDYPETNQYLSLIKATDDAFKDLLEYFSNVDEPTIILMYGDHQPFIENGFYEEVMGQSLSSMSDETGQLRYITRFILWANYDIPEGWIDQISVNYLSTLLTEVAGTEKTEYNSFLDTMYTEVPVITALGCIDCNGNYFKADDSSAEYAEDVLTYRQVAYNNLIDEKNRSKTLFYLKKDENEK